MKNFDIERQARSIRPAADRTFLLGGETFIRRASVPAEVMVDLDEIGAGTSAGRVLEIVSGVVGEMCEPPAIEKWAALRARKGDQDPLTIGDVMMVVQWLIAEETELPTSEPAPSGNGSLTPSPGDDSTAPAPSAASIHPISAADASFVPGTPG